MNKRMLDVREVFKLYPLRKMSGVFEGVLGLYGVYRLLMLSCFESFNRTEGGRWLFLRSDKFWLVWYAKKFCFQKLL